MVVSGGISYYLGFGLVLGWLPIGDPSARHVADGLKTTPIPTVMLAS